MNEEKIRALVEELRELADRIKCNHGTRFGWAAAINCAAKDILQGLDADAAPELEKPSHPVTTQ